MDPKEIEEIIKKEMKVQHIDVQNPRKDGLHFEALIVSSAFEGKSLLEQHQMVMPLLQNHFEENLHAFSLKTLTPKEWAEKCVDDTLEKIDQDVKHHLVILFMKGSKEEPMCGFSARVVTILNALNVAYETRNVLEDDTLRLAIKKYSNWPTLPQLYIKGEFIGGCDVVTELYESGKLNQYL